MGYASAKIGRIRAKAQAAWGTPASSWADANTLDVEAVIPPTTIEALMTQTLRGTWHEPKIKAGARRGASFTLKGYCPGISSTTPSGNPSAHPLGVLTASVLGGAVAGGYTASALTSGGAADSIQFSAGQANTAWGGLAQLIPLVGGSRGIAWLKDVTAGTPDTATVVLDLPDDPASSGAVYGSYVAYMSKDQQLPFTVRWQGGDDKACVDFVDCVVSSIKFTFDAGKQPMFEATVLPGYFESKVGSTLGDPGPYAVSYPPMGAAIGRLGARFVTDGGAMDTDKCELTLTTEWAEVRGHASMEGVARFVATSRKAELSLTYAATDLSNWGSPGDNAGAVQIDLGVVPGAAMSVLIPSAVITQRSELGDENGVAAFTAKMGPAYYAGDGAGAGVAGQSVVRVAWL